MVRSIAELCRAAHERCKQAQRLTGDERRLYLHDAINKLYAALDLYAEVDEEPLNPLGKRSEAMSKKESLFEERSD